MNPIVWNEVASDASASWVGQARIESACLLVDFVARQEQDFFIVEEDGTPMQWWRLSAAVSDGTCLDVRTPFRSFRQLVVALTEERVLAIIDEAHLRAESF